jgi:tetratricopeptide (TPR) repeat protein
LFEKALETSPQCGEAHRNLGHVYASGQEYEQALTFYAEALRLDPRDQVAISHIAKAQTELQISKDPDYAFMPAAPWAADAWIWEEIANSSTLLVLFAGLGIAGNQPTFIFANFLKPYQQVDKLFIRDLDMHWYLNGLGNLSNSIDETTDFIKDKITGYKRVIFIGCSAGGMAAILFGERLKADKILAFAPQTVLSAAKEIELGDQRWLRQMASLRAEHGESEYMDLRNLNPFTTDIDIHYSADYEIDDLHAKCITGTKVNYIPHTDAEGHLIALHLRDTGMLKEILEREIHYGKKE